jgi:hypothetical protein
MLARMRPMASGSIVPLNRSLVHTGPENESISVALIGAKTLILLPIQF